MRFLLIPCFVLSGCLFDNCSNNNNPQPGECDDPTKDTVTMLELGISDEHDHFVLLADGDAVPTRYGGQGSLMATVRLRLPELAPGTCVGQDVRVIDSDGNTTAHSSTPLRLVDDGGDGVTPEIFLPGDYYHHAVHYTVIARVGNVEVRRDVVIGGEEPTPDLATLDLATPDLHETVDFARAVDLRNTD